MAYTEGTFLAPPDFSARFRSAWDHASSRFLKVERRQSYDQTGDPSFDAFVAGDLPGASELLRAALLTQKEMYSRARDKGVALVRLRQVELPLTPYLAFYEFPSYRVSAELGEAISVASPPAESGRDLLPDCIVFDATVMFVNLYDGLGRTCGAVEVMDQKIIAEHIALAEGLLAHSQPLEAFMHANGI